MPRKSITSFWQLITGKTNYSSVNIACQRFLQAFQDHGIEAPQIPRLFPEVRLADLENEKSLLSVLTPELLDRVAKFFGVRVEWLEGISEQIYDYRACYKEPIRLLEHLRSLLIDDDTKHQFPIRVLCTSKELDSQKRPVQSLAPVILEKIADLGDDEIFKYHIYRDGFDWDYYPARIELKAIARLVFRQLHIPVPLYEISFEDMEAVVEGRIIPCQLLNGCPITSPSLEDYAISPDESLVAKEVDELPEVLRYIEEQGLTDFKLDSLTQSCLAELSTSKGDTGDTNDGASSVKANAIRAASKKHESTNRIKERFIQFFNEHGSEYQTKSSAARTFIKSVLSEKERLQFKNSETAERALLSELRKRL